MAKPIDGTYPPAFTTYTSKVKEDDLTLAFKNQQALIDSFFDSIPKDKEDFAYAPGKWTLKEMLQHIIDTERIFAYRALCIARREKQSLPGFDENEYAKNSQAAARSWQSMTTELKLIRQSTELMFESFSEDTLQLSGLANNKPVTVNALGFVIVGHINHHLEVINERYLSA